MELLHLQYFYTVAKTLNISRAAEIHRIPQPSMSKTISRLEKELGVSLFSREKNHLALTRCGQAFLREVELSLQHLDRGIDAVKNYTAEVSGQLKIQALSYRTTLVDMIKSFTDMYPRATFQIFSNPSTSDSYDLCIAGNLYELNKLYDSRELLIRERLDIAVPLQSPLAQREVLRIDELRHEQFIILDYNHEIFQRLSAAAGQCGFTPQVSVSCNDLYCFEKFLYSGMGLTIAPTISWRQVCKGVAVFIPLEPALYRDMYIYWNRKNMQDPLIKLFKNHLTGCFNEMSTEYSLGE